VIALGIDPGSRRCGYGVVARLGSRLEVVESGVLAPGGGRALCERLGEILCGLEAVIARAGPAEVAVESAFFGLSARSALVLGQARGVALAAAARAGLPVFEYAPAQVKRAFAGNGRAEKAQMIRMAQTILGVSADLSDEADALAIAVCHLASRAGALRLGAGASSARAGGQSAERALSRLRPSVRRPGSAA
jgi:crossover junction endodeoxyribonuclease RuvC